ncbi:hypothetical protein BHE74_00021832, partial [Ensete ventricosum]
MYLISLVRFVGAYNEHSFVQVGQFINCLVDARNELQRKYAKKSQAEIIIW